MKTNRSNSIGSTLLSVLFVLSILGLLSIYSHRSLRQAVKIRTRDYHASLARGRALTKALTQLPTSSPAGGGIHCKATSARAGQVLLDRSLCVLFPKLPLLKVRDLFQKTSACQQSESHAGNLSPGGRMLAASALLSTITCLKPGEPAITDGNVSIHADFNLPRTSTHPKFGGLSILASTGFLELEGSLIIEDDTLIVAGGDLFIHSLTTLDSSPTSVYLLSASGSLVVKEVVGNFRLEAHGAKGVYLPSGLSNQSGTTALSLLDWYFLGTL